MCWVINSRVLASIKKFVHINPVVRCNTVGHAEILYTLMSVKSRLERIKVRLNATRSKTYAL
jgi:division protein CdvB (Snf7/Vps24/ESCRT-III family)